MDAYETIIHEICNGNFEHLPPATPSSIRIFLSSTTKDYRVERDYIIKTIYTDLREYFQKLYGFDFTLIDLRWGITRDKAISNLITTFCLNEIQSCLDESIGPAFIAFVGERYGSIPLKEAINKDEFEIILKNTEPIVFKGFNLLKYLYELDENDDSNEKYYKLKSKEQAFSDIPGLKDDWKGGIKFELLNRLCASAKKNFKMEQARKFFTSVTEEEIIKGIIENEDANKNSLAIFRKIIYNESDIDKLKSEGYLNTDESEQMMLNELINNIETKLSGKNRHYLEVDWRKSNCLDENSNETKEYLNKFRNILTISMTSLIEKAIQKHNAYQLPKLCNNDIELIHHATFCNSLMKHFIERPIYIKKVSEYINDVTNNKPFIIYGPSGTGKSSIMSSLVQKLKNSDSIVAIRFMGTSAQSSSIYSVFKSLIYQFSKLLSNKQANECLKDALDARDYLFNSILSEHNIKNQRVIILLDSIDQLIENDHNLRWMVYKLPKNVKLIFTILDEDDSMLQQIKEKLDFIDANYMEVLDLKIDSSIKQLNQRLKNEKRTLQPAQLDLIKYCLRKTRKIYPLHIKLLSDICINWRSSYLPEENDNIVACNTIKNTIKYLFRKYESHYGTILFSRCVFYLTIFKNGISESELEDILSIDDVVLNDIFVKYEPPLRRFPNSIWLKIKNNLKDYLTLKQADDTMLISWYHRSFYEATEEFYCEIFKESYKRDAIIQNIIDYFNEEWREKAKLYTFKNESGNLINKMAPRYTKSQKLKFTLKDRNCVVYNNRKLNELLNMILLLHNVELKINYLIEYIYFNCSFMHCKAELKDMKFVIHTHLLVKNLNEFVHKTNDFNDTIRDKAKQLFEISNIYKTYYGTFLAYPDSLPYQVISRISNQYAEKFIKSSLGVVCLVPVQHSFLKTSDEEVLFMNNEYVRNITVRWLYNSPYILLQYLCNGVYKFSLLNYLNLEHINLRCELDGKYSCIRALFTFYFNLKSKAITRDVNEIDGGILYTDTLDEDQIYLKTLNNNTNYSIKSFTSRIKEMFLISLKCILIRYEFSFEIINFNDYNNPYMCYNSGVFDDEILNLQSTMPTSDNVITTDYDSLDYTMLVSMFKTKILIYKFDKLKREIKIENKIQIEFNLNYNYKLGFMIDKDYFLQSILYENRLCKIKNESRLIRILVLSGIRDRASRGYQIDKYLKFSTLNVFLDNNTNQLSYNIENQVLNKKTNLFDENNSKGSHLVFYDFYFNKIACGIVYSGLLAELIIFELSENVSTVKLKDSKITSNKKWEKITIVDENTILFLKQYSPYPQICMFSINESKYFEKKFSDEIANYKLINSKFIYVAGDANESVMKVEIVMNNDQEIENDEKNMNQLLPINEIHGFIDNEHLFLIESCGNMVNVVNQEIKYSIELNNNSILVGFNRHLILIWKNSTFCCEVYSVIYSNSSDVEVNKIDDIRFQYIQPSKYNLPKHFIKCYFFKYNQKQFIISAFNQHEKFFEINKYEFIKNNKLNLISTYKAEARDFTNANTNLLQIKMNLIEIVIYCLTYLNNFLVYVRLTSESDFELIPPTSSSLQCKYAYAIDCKNITTNQFLKITSTFQCQESIRILELKNEDDFIIYSKDYCAYYSIDKAGQYMNKYQIELGESIEDLRAYENILLITSCQANYFKKFLVFDIKRKRVIKSVQTSLIVSAHITPNLKYLIVYEQIEYSYGRLKIVYLDKEKEVFQLPLFSDNLLCNNKYVSVRLDKKFLLTFSLVDLKFE